MQKQRLLYSVLILLIITGCNTSEYRSSSHPISARLNHDNHPETVSVSGSNNNNVSENETDETAITSNSEAVVHEDVWERIGTRLTLDHHLQHRSVKDKLAWYARNQDYLDRVADRARPYLYYIVEEIEARNMPLEIALLPVVESAFQPFAYSPDKASGLWQFIPGTGKLYGLKQNWWYDGRRDITAATQAALNYLEKLHKEFNGDWLLALAAYNTGENNVAKAIRRNKRAGKELDFFSLKLPRETRGYVPSLLAVAELVANPRNHGIRWDPIPNKQYFTIVDAGSQIDLALVSSLSGLSMDDVYTLNPAYNRWATDPDGPHSLLIPVDIASSFEEKLSTIPDNERISWKRHVIKQGESLGLIAANYHTDVDTLRLANGIRGNMIRTGNSLLIPTSKQPLKNYTLSMDARRFQGLKKTGSGEKYIYTVRRGDSLWDIGRQYGVSIDRLCSWNGISSSSYLRPGQKLTLWLAEDGQALLADRASGQNTDSGSLAGNGEIYTVASGDSLWLIANRNGTTVSQLRTLNNLSTNNLLKPGQKLKLRLSPDLSVAENDNSENPPADEPVKSEGMNYTVRNGDSLWLIARRFNTTITDIMQNNNLINADNLKPGQVLVLQLPDGKEPGSASRKSTAINYTVKKGDSLWLISRRFGTTVNQLISWNKLWNNKHLQPGQKLVLYITEV